MADLDATDPRVVAAVDAIGRGDTTALAELLVQHPELAAARIGDARTSRTLLHVLTDWPGRRPNGAATVATLVAAGADVDARFAGPHRETPLHWAASSDDVAVLDALLDAGADIDADGAVIGGGTALLDATAFGQWAAARRLVERGAAVGFWEAAALGHEDRVRDALEGDDRPTADEVTGAFWGACHGGQRGTAELLLANGADLDRVGWDELTPYDAAVRSGAEELAAWVAEQGGRPARDIVRDSG